MKEILHKMASIIMPLFLSVNYCVQFWLLPSQKEIVDLEKVQNRVTKMTTGLSSSLLRKATEFGALQTWKKALEEGCDWDI